MLAIILVEAWGSEASLENSRLAGVDDAGVGKAGVQSALLRYGSSTQFAASRDDPEPQRSSIHL